MKYRFILALSLMLTSNFILISCGDASYSAHNKERVSTVDTPIVSEDTMITKIVTPVLDTADYLKRMNFLAHDSITDQWPTKTALPKPGAILPFKRIIAYYGNFYSKNMGILGELSEENVISRLRAEVELWSKADSTTEVIPAIHYIAVTAQSSPGAGGMYRLRMPASQIERTINLAEKVNGLAFLDIQVGHSTVQKEIPALKEYLMHPKVHLGIDPEWSMKGGQIPGKKIGTMDATDVNFAIQYLTDLVKEYNLPPKILIVHRFTKGMLTNADKIVPTPEVQVVVTMDGFGFPAKKVSSYNLVIMPYPVQFTGFKLFYKNDKWDKPTRLMTPKEILNLYPKPIYIQYQ